MCDDGNLLLGREDRKDHGRVTKREIWAVSPSHGTRGKGAIRFGEAVPLLVSLTRRAAFTEISHLNSTVSR